MTDVNSHTLHITQFHPDDPRLGRHVAHDSRSLRFLAPRTTDITKLKSVKHVSLIPTLDQGQIGSCTGNASTKCLSYVPFWGAAVAALLSQTNSDDNEKYAVSVYSAATKVDNYDGMYLPTDTGSDGLSVAKVLQSAGLINGYTHATDFNSLATALQDQPVIVGTSWHEGQYEPDADGRLHITGKVAGGHEYVIDEIDIENQWLWMQNSWNDSWGIEGRAYYTFADFTTLLKDDGDVTVFTPLTQPAPVPTPVPIDPEGKWKAAADTWLSHHHTSKVNVAMVKATVEYREYLDTKDA